MFSEAEVIAERFHVVLPEAPIKPTYNAAPAEKQLTIVNAEPEVITVSTWGFVPEWASGRKDVKAIINARAETVATKPFFRQAFKTKRCLVLADGFYEWQKVKDGKVPYRITLKTEEPFAFAGIWSNIHDAAGKEQQTFAIITTEANELMAPIHNRMPVMLHAQDEEDWLNPQASLDDVQAMLAPFPAELLTAYKVSTKVNSPTHNTPEVLERV